MSMKAKIIFFNFSSSDELRLKLEKSLVFPKKVEVICTANPNIVLKVLKANPQTIFIFSALTTSGSTLVESVLIEYSKLKNGGVFSIGVTSAGNIAEADALKSLGVNYVFTEETPLDMISMHLNKRIELFLDNEKSREHKVTIKADSQNENLEQKVPSHLASEQINLESGKMTLKTKEENLTLKLEHFDENSLDLEISTSDSYLYNSGDQIELNIIFEYNRCKIELLLDGTIETIELNSPETSSLCIKLTMNEQENLERFMALYSQRQKSIDDFMMLARGVS